MTLLKCNACRETQYEDELNHGNCSYCGSDSLVEREVSHIKRIEKATESVEYKTYATVAGAALAGALLSTDKASREAALKQYRDTLAKQAELVRKEVT
jgi:DNA-directed RNA polymerase subunit RPC12/RpoP